MRIRVQGFSMTEARVCMNRRKFRNYITSGGKRASIQPSKQLGLFLTDGTSFAPLTYARQTRGETRATKRKGRKWPRYRLTASPLLSLRDDSSQRNLCSTKKRIARLECLSCTSSIRWIFELYCILVSKFISMPLHSFFSFYLDFILIIPIEI